jgi:hypothetical protein
MKYLAGLVLILGLAGCGKDLVLGGRYDAVCFLPMGVVSFEGVQLEFLSGGVASIKKEKPDKTTDTIIISAAHCIFNSVE